MRFVSPLYKIKEIKSDTKTLEDFQVGDFIYFIKNFDDGRPRTTTIVNNPQTKGWSIITDWSFDRLLKNIVLDEICDGLYDEYVKCL